MHHTIDWPAVIYYLSFTQYYSLSLSPCFSLSPLLCLSFSLSLSLIHAHFISFQHRINPCSLLACLCLGTDTQLWICNCCCVCDQLEPAAIHYNAFIIWYPVYIVGLLFCYVFFVVVVVVDRFNWWWWWFTKRETTAVQCRLVVRSVKKHNDAFIMDAIKNIWFSGRAHTCTQWVERIKLFILKRLYTEGFHYTKTILTLSF